MRRAIVHIGLPRTGTTTLQRVLVGSRDRLAAAGILYPDLTPGSATEPHLSHQHLGETLDGRRPASERRELLGVLATTLRQADADTAVLSYEGLCWRHSRWPGRPRAETVLREVLDAAGYAMEVLVTVKPQAEYLNSMYTLRSQCLKERRVFGDFLDAQLGSARLDYETLLRPWRAAAAGRVHVVPVRDARDAEPLVPRILRAVGVLDRIAPLPDGDRTLVENRSPGPAAVEVSRRLRISRGRRVVAVPPRDATRFLEAEARRRGLDDDGFQGVSPDFRTRVEAEYADGNERLARWAWNGRWSDRVAQAPAKPVNEIAIHPVPAALDAELDMLQQAVVARFSQAGRLAPGSRRP